MHQENPGAFLYLHKKDLLNNLESLKECTRKIQVHFLYIYNNDLIRKLEGIHQEDPGAFSIYIFNKDSKRKLEGMHPEDPGAFSIYLQQGVNTES